MKDSVYVALCRAPYMVSQCSVRARVLHCDTVLEPHCETVPIKKSLLVLARSQGYPALWNMRLVNDFSYVESSFLQGNSVGVALHC